MSSTNRSAAREKHKSDYYITPKYAIRDFLREFLKSEHINENSYILDPCAGGDVKHGMSYPDVLKEPEFNFTEIATIDVREDSLACLKKSYLDYDVNENDGQPDLIITNPPFNESMDIIKKSLKDVKEFGFVVMLQRLNFLGGVTEKKKFWDEVGLPKYIFVHRKRMSFTDDGKTDSIEYAHYVWLKNDLIKRDFSMVKII